MRTLGSLVLCLILVGCLSGQSKAEGLWDLGKDCACSTGDKCICGPGCQCPSPAVGCPTNAGGVTQDVTYSVGADIPTGYHYEQRCSGNVCQMVLVPNQVQYVSVSSPATTWTFDDKAGSKTICPCCGMEMTAEQAAKMKGKQVTISAPTAVTGTLMATTAPCATCGPTSSFTSTYSEESTGGGGRRRLFGRRGGCGSRRGGGGCGG